MSSTLTTIQVYIRAHYALPHSYSSGWVKKLPYAMPEPLMAICSEKPPLSGIVFA